MIDLTKETPLPLAVAARLVPAGRNGKKTHLSTLLRWITRGAKTPSGEIARLEALRLGSRWVTSAAALQRFAAALTPPLSDAPTSAPPSPAARKRASEKAEAELKKLGVI